MAGPKNLLGFGCCSGGDGAVPCPLTIALAGCSGGPISGASIGIFNPSGGSVGGGTTDSSGSYTFPDPTPAGASYYTLTYEGAAYAPAGYASGFAYRWPYPGLSASFCNSPLRLTFYNAKLTATYTDASATLVDTAHSWDYTNTTPGTTVFTYLHIYDSSVEPGFPWSVCLDAYTNPAAGTSVEASDGYVRNCATASVACPSSQTIDIPMYYFLADYWGYDFDCDTGCNGGAAPGGPAGCTSVGEGPDYRGLFPRKLYATFNADAGSPGVLAFNPGTMAGTSIELDYVGPPAQPSSPVWQSACLPYAAYGPGSPGALLANYARVTVVQDQSAPNVYTINFTSYLDLTDSGCTTGSGCYSCNSAWSVPACALTEPVDATTPYAIVTG